jgi:hypothetical protein
MAFPRFDPARALKFDLGRGQIEMEGARPRVVVPSDALFELCRAAGRDAQVDFGRRLGTEAGRRTAEALEGGVAGASLEAVVEHLGGNLALLGFGSLGLERWGKALVFTVDDSPFGAEGDALLAAVIEGALQRAVGREGQVVLLARDDARARFAVLSKTAAASVRSWLDAGASWGEVLARLHRTKGEA